MDRRKYILDIVTNIIGDPVKAEVVVDRLIEEGVLHLGYGDREVDAVVNKFKEVFGNTKTTKQDRWAANRLVQNYGAQPVVGIISLLGQLRDQPYAPVANSVAELENKIISIINFLRKQKGTEEIQI